MQFIFFQVLIKRIKAIRYFLKDKSVPLRRKIIIAAGILYLLMPIDLIPEPIFIFGIVDDIILWTFIIWYFKSELDRYWIDTDPVRSREKFRDKNIIDDVNFEVKTEQDKGEEEQK
ncbi:MAG TPA: DUF1232 domain-containing protein [Anaerovoracaceae bacterium]|nr:DUF1232 domain-containing protein [Anaerovoracaceae bacterium]